MLLNFVSRKVLTHHLWQVSPMEAVLQYVSHEMSVVLGPDTSVRQFV
ncbi:hypothetical protein SAMN05216379_13020 [Nitrosomonas eutropha]|nr:hypothetical protein SAMN05216379_13020 [Nitrosomonas eutropha]